MRITPRDDLFSRVFSDAATTTKAGENQARRAACEINHSNPWVNSTPQKTKQQAGEAPSAALVSPGRRSCRAPFYNKKHNVDFHFVRIMFERLNRCSSSSSRTSRRAFLYLVVLTNPATGVLALPPSSYVRYLQQEQHSPPWRGSSDRQSGPRD